MRVKEAISLLRIQFLDRGSGETTWRTEYQKVLKWLPPEAELSTGLLVDLVQSKSSRNTRTRVRFLMVATQLAAIAGIPWTADPLKPQRGKRGKISREMPTDRQILEFWKGVAEKRPDWAWVVGMMAAFGLRNHEVFLCRFHPDIENAVEVTEGKTGARVAFALYPEWVDRFDLIHINHPPIDLTRSHDRIGHSITEFFSRVEAPFRPYDLRHAWAIRAHLKFRLSTTVAARCLGHAEEVHRKIYLRWISVAQAQAEIAQATSGHGAPKAPL